ncbi:hypothetical protein MTO96_039836, partial [Rhipicephalus appendiculatus]
ALELGQHQESLVDQEIDLFEEGEAQNTVIGSPRDDGKYYAGSDRWVDKESWDLLMKAPMDFMFCRAEPLWRRGGGGGSPLQRLLKADKKLFKALSIIAAEAAENETVARQIDLIINEVAKMKSLILEATH